MTAVRPLRKDAAANRAKVVEAAEQVFGELGLDAGVDEVARRAGVGMGTLYRSFATKQLLIDELIGNLRRHLLELATAAVDRPDGIGLEELLLATGELQSTQSGCLARLWNRSDAEQASLEEFRATVARLLGAAQQAGRIRPEVTPGDISMVFWSLRGVIETTRGVVDDAWRRHLELLLAGLRPPSDERFTQPLKEKPVSPEQARQVAATQS